MDTKYARPISKKFNYHYSHLTWVINATKVSVFEEREDHSRRIVSWFDLLFAYGSNIGVLKWTTHPYFCVSRVIFRITLLSRATMHRECAQRDTSSGTNYLFFLFTSEKSAIQSTKSGIKNFVTCHSQLHNIWNIYNNIVHHIY